MMPMSSPDPKDHPDSLPVSLQAWRDACGRTEVRGCPQAAERSLRVCITNKVVDGFLGRGFGVGGYEALLKRSVMRSLEYM
jgi:hypothetical protein